MKDKKWTLSSGTPVCVEVYEVKIYDSQDGIEVTLHLVVEEKTKTFDLPNAAKLAQGYWGSIVSIKHLGDAFAVLGG